MDSSGQKIINPIKKVIVDTDPGIDDAMAIMLALSAHKKQTVEVVAITLVSGNSDTDNAKVNILRVLETNGLEDEVYFSTIVIRIIHYYIGTRNFKTTTLMVPFLLSFSRFQDPGLCWSK